MQNIKSRWQQGVIHSQRRGVAGWIYHLNHFPQSYLENQSDTKTFPKEKEWKKIAQKHHTALNFTLKTTQK